MERPTFVPLHYGYQTIEGGKKSNVAKVELSDGTSWILKELKDGFKKPEKAEMKALELYEQFKMIERYLGPYVAETRFLAWPNPTGGHSVYSMQRYLEGVSFEKGLALAQETGDVYRFKDFLTRCLQMYEGKKVKKIIPDISGSDVFFGWWKPETTPNIIVNRDVNGVLSPILIDVGFISEELGTQWFLHNRVLGMATKRLLKSLG